VAAIPRADRAIISKAKIADYFLSPDHPKGGPKAEFFLRFGFTRSGWRVLANALREHAGSQPIISRRQTPFGEIHEVKGPLSTPDGRNPTIRSAWIVLDGDANPRFVTAVPA
jgi:hypothetical protein